MELPKIGWLRVLVMLAWLHFVSTIISFKRALTRAI